VQRWVGTAAEAGDFAAVVRRFVTHQAEIESRRMKGLVPYPVAGAFVVEANFGVAENGGIPVTDGDTVAVAGPMAVDRRQGPVDTIAPRGGSRGERVGCGG